MARVLRWNGLVALIGLASGVAFCGTTNAQVKPWKIAGAGIGPFGVPLPGQDPRPHWSIGEATHMGKYYGEGAVHTESAVFDPDTGHITGTFGSAVPFVFVGANGDQLACHYGRDGDSYIGAFTLVPYADGRWVAFWVADFVPVLSECTGKFEGIKGSWTMYAMSEPFDLGSTDPLAYMWVGEGQLEFKK